MPGSTGRRTHAPVPRYRHGEHAGNFADVHKHALLARVFGALRGRGEALAYVETHAGRGIYTLEGSAHRDGAARLWGCTAPPAGLAPYWSAVRACNGDRLLRYPGSPAIARSLLRPGDRAVLVEIDPAEGAALRAHFAADPRVTVHLGDAGALLGTLLPPPEPRGLLLVDPGYLDPEEFAAAAALVNVARARWPGGTVMLWYPLLAGAPERGLLERVRACGATGLLDVRMEVAAPERRRLYGCGCLIGDPPPRSVEALARLNRWLAARLAQDRDRAETRWLTPPSRG